MIDPIERIMPEFAVQAVGDLRASCTYATGAFLVECVDWLSSGCQSERTRPEAEFMPDDIVEVVWVLAQVIHDETPTRRQEEVM